MDELEISGRRFISSRRAAKEHHYHTDYIGQLVRGGKVVGQKVGRSWYVDEQSLLAYLQKEVAPTPEVAVPAAPISDVVETTPEVEDEVPQDTAVESIVETASVPLRVVEEKEKVTEPTEHYVPIHIVASHSKKQSSNLIYVTDDKPLLPQMQRVMPAAAAPSVAVSDVAAPEAAAQPRGAYRSGRGRTLALVSVGVLALVSAAALSSLLAAEVRVGEGQTASFGFSLF